MTTEEQQPEQAATQAPPVPVKAEFKHEDPNMKQVCRWFMNRKCKKQECEFIHDKRLCFFFWKNGTCKYDDKCRKNHFVTLAASKTDEDEGHATDDASNTEPEPEKVNEQPKSTKKNNKKLDDKKKKRRAVKKNTESWEPMAKPVDLRIVYDLGRSNEKFSTALTSRDVLLAPNIFSDFKKGELYEQLVKEIEACSIPKDRLLKMWHGNDKIDGTHLIADDKTRWKKECPTFDLVIKRLQTFFNMNIQATRFNWYKDTSQWKPFHFDAAAVKPEKAEVQNFTVAVSFGATRDAAFEHDATRAVISLPQPDGCVYAFAKDTNILWRHGILQDVPVRQEGRISVIAWGWVDGMRPVEDNVVAGDASEAN